MQETLLPLELPAGFLNNGTTYQSKGRWFKGNLVRFFQGNKQPIGGWVQRTLTGATIAGTPNAAISWQLNSGATYLAVGTTTNLYIVNALNVVYDITPAGAVGDGLTHLWQLDVFGSYLVATFNRTTFVDTGTMNAFVWTGNVGTIAAPAYTYAQGPGSAYGVAVTPERFLLILRGADPNTYPTRAVAGSILTPPATVYTTPVIPSPF